MVVPNPGRRPGRENRVFVSLTAALLIRSSFLLGLFLFTGVSATGQQSNFRMTVRPTIPFALSNFAAQDQTAARVLVPGAPIDRELRGSESHTYRVTLVPGQYLRLFVAQKGINVILKLSGPDSGWITEVNNQNGAQLEEEVSLVAVTPGEYRFEVSAAEKNAIAGRYEIRIAELREATSTDNIRIAAERDYAQGEIFRLQGTAESLHKAVAKFEAALPLGRSAADGQGQALALNRLGLIYRQWGEYQKALECFGQALELSRAARDRQAEAFALNGLARIYLDQGENQKALEYHNQAFLLSRALRDRANEGYAVNGMGVVYWLLGDNQKALEYFSQALLLRRDAMDRLGEANTLNNIGTVYRSWGETQKALDYFNQGLALTRALGSRRGEANTLDNIGTIYATLGDSQKALEYLSQALLAWQSLGDRLGEAQTQISIGGIYRTLSESEKARESYQQALALSRAIKNPPNEAAALFGIARIERADGQLKEARAQIEAALEIIDSVRISVPNSDLRASYLASKKIYYEFYIDLLMQLEGQEATALQASERARARSLLDSLKEARVDIRQGVDAALLARERSLQQDVNGRAERLTRLLSGKHTEEQAATAKAELETLVTDYQQVEVEIRSNSPRYAALTQPQPLDINTIQSEVVDADTLLLEYSLGTDRSFLWAVTPTAVLSYVLPGRARIEAPARRMYELLTTRNQNPPNETPTQKVARLSQADAEYDRVSADLSQMLLGPVAGELRSKRLLIVGEDVLQYLPFGALPIPDGNPGIRAEEASLRNRSTSKRRLLSVPLILEHEIVSLPSASVLLALRRESKVRGVASSSVAVFADPVFAANDPRVKLSRDGSARTTQVTPKAAGAGSSESAVDRSAKESGVTDFRRLLHSREEADAIMKMAAKDQSLEAVDFVSSRRTALDANLSRYRILHFATHGLLNSQHPELSGVVLSLVDEQGRPVDGFLRLHEIYNLKLNSDLVVLSACRTALGKEIKGEGLVGLTRGFMYAGSPSVLASLWSVDDEATAELMKRFYKAMLKEGRPPAAALRAAQASMWQEKRWGSPPLWAAFVLQGEWK